MINESYYNDLMDDLFTENKVVKDAARAGLNAIDNKVKNYSNTEKHPVIGKGLKAIGKAGDTALNGVGKITDAGSKMVLKHPGENASASELRKYNNAMKNIRLNVKVGALAAAGMVAVGPLDPIVKAGTLLALGSSDDNETKLVKKKYKEATVALADAATSPVKTASKISATIKAKALALKTEKNSIVNKLKSLGNSPMGQDIVNAVKSIDKKAQSLAKEIDAAKSKVSSGRIGVKQESFDDYVKENSYREDEYMNRVFNILYTESGELVKTPFQNLFKFINESTFESYDDYIVASLCVDTLDKEINN